MTLPREVTLLQVRNVEEKESPSSQRMWRAAYANLSRAQITSCTSFDKSCCAGEVTFSRVQISRCSGMLQYILPLCDGCRADRQGWFEVLAAKLSVDEIRKEFGYIRVW